MMPYLSEEKRKQAIEKTFTFYCEVKQHLHIYDYPVLATLAQWLSASEQKALLGKAQEALARWLSTTELETLMKDPLAYGLCDDNPTAHAIIECALYLSSETCKLALVHYRQNTWENGNLLSALASRLSTELLKETFIAACECKEGGTIGALCPYLPTDFPIELLEVALSSCRTIEDGHCIDNVLTELIAYLSVNSQARAVATINDVNPYRIYKSLFLATYLPTAQFRAIVEAVITNKSWGLNKLITRVQNLRDNELKIILSKIKEIIDASGPYTRSINRLMLAVSPYSPTNELRKILKQAILDARTGSSHQLHRADSLIVLIPLMTGEEQQEIIEESFAEICNYSSISPIHMWACVCRLSKLSPYLPPKMIYQARDFIQEFENRQGQSVGLGILALHFHTNERNRFLTEALNTSCTTDDATGEFGLQDFEPHLTRWAIEQPEPAHAALAENLPILAAKPRGEFMHDLAALMPFILALAGDEAPQAAEGIYQAIQEVCGWWP
ncbi:MAG: hypothetical protein R3E79_40365 [Caldilineaceae bacterium]